ncbi:MAG TPA: sulfite exporter TauE/SafE family protein [Acidimicrobiales bacterium]|nr:sulfite exporter TauE/SafE family protein [Acidimicrobiales bacterium]
MHLDPVLILGAGVVGLLVGMTGMGGGALMTPMLVLLFGVSPSAAISSDLVAALFMKPAGVVIHWRRRTIQSPIVKYLCIGSVPAAFAGTYVMHLLGQSAAAEKNLEIALGAALVIGAASMVVRSILVTHAPSLEAPRVRPAATVAVGVVGGFMVGLTSVGAGSLILVLLLTLYPSLRNDRLVGTDLAQSIPLTASATVGALLFGHVTLGVTGSIIIGSVPMVVVGSLISSHPISVRLRPLLTGVVLLSGLKYLGLPTHELGLAAIPVAAAVAVAMVLERQRGRAARATPAPVEVPA